MLWKLLPKKMREKLEAPYRYDAQIEIKRILANAGEKKVRVLDVGAGDCFAKTLLIKAHTYTAIDVKPQFPDVQSGDVQNLEFRDGSFDLVLCFEVLEYVSDPVKAASEIYRVLRGGGITIISTPLLSVGYHNDRQRWSPPGLRALIQNAGFGVESIKPMGGYYRMLGWQISKLSGKIRKPSNKFFWPFYYAVKIPMGLIFQIIVPFVFFHLDFLDKEKRDTCGYVVVARKE